MSLQERTKPWIAAGMSRSAWYRQQKSQASQNPTPSQNPVSPPPPPVRDRKISLDAVARSYVKPQKRSLDEYAIPVAPPWVPRSRSLAMDQSLAATNVWAGDFFIGGTETIEPWPGFAILSELALRPEYSVVSSVIAEECTRKWIKLQATGDDDRTEQIAEMEEEFKRFCVREHFHSIALHDGLFGRAHLYIDTGDGDDRDELLTDLGDGINAPSRYKSKKGYIQDIRAIEPWTCYPQQYNSTNPLLPHWYAPQTWLCNAMEVHKSRLIPFVGRPVPEIVRPRYMWAGLSRTQILMPYVGNWLSTRQAVNDLIRAFTQFVLATDLQATLSVGGDDFFDRLKVFTNARSNFGIMAVNKDTEELSNISVPLSGLDALQAQAQEHMAAISRVPLVKLLGISPHGLNASSEGEIRVFYDHILAFQEQFFRPGLERVFRFLQLNRWGRVIPELTFAFEPLWAADDVEKAAIRKTDAEADQVLIDAGVISQREARVRVAGDPETPYPGLDVNELPDLKEEEAEGLEPEGGRPNPIEETDKPQDGKEPDEEDQ